MNSEGLTETVEHKFCASRSVLLRTEWTVTRVYRADAWNKILFDFLKKRQYNYRERVASKRKSSLPATRFHFTKMNIVMKKCVACQRKSSLYDRVRTFFVPKRKEVTCSHHLNLTILKWGLPAQLPFRAKLKQAIPACPAVLFFMFIRLRIFFLCRQAHSL